MDARYLWCVLLSVLVEHHVARDGNGLSIAYASLKEHNRSSHSRQSRTPYLLRNLTTQLAATPNSSTAEPLLGHRLLANLTTQLDVTPNSSSSEPLLFDGRSQKTVVEYSLKPANLFFDVNVKSHDNASFPTEPTTAPHADRHENVGTGRVTTISHVRRDTTTTEPTAADRDSEEVDASEQTSKAPGGLTRPASASVDYNTLYSDYYDSVMGVGQDPGSPDKSKVRADMYEDREYYYNDDYIEADFDSISQIAPTSPKLFPTPQNLAQVNEILPDPVYLFAFILALFGLIQIILGRRDREEGTNAHSFDGAQSENTATRENSASPPGTSSPPNGDRTRMKSPSNDKFTGDAATASAENFVKQARKLKAVLSKLPSVGGFGGRRKQRASQKYGRRKKSSLGTIDEEPLSV